jgi:hypothetical protein
MPVKLVEQKVQKTRDATDPHASFCATLIQEIDNFARAVLIPTSP